MKKLPFFILMAALSTLHPAAYAETETAKPSTTTTSEIKTGEQPAAATTEAAPADTDKKAEGEQPAAATTEAAPADAEKKAEGEQPAAAATTDTKPAADAKQADSGEKKADKKGDDEPDCN